jgi:hypothetical protein
MCCSNYCWEMQSNSNGIVLKAFGRVTVKASNFEPSWKLPSSRFRGDCFLSMGSMLKSDDTNLSKRLKSPLSRGSSRVSLSKLHFSRFRSLFNFNFNWCLLVFSFLGAGSDERTRTPLSAHQKRISFANKGEHGCCDLQPNYVS